MNPAAWWRSKGSEESDWEKHKNQAFGVEEIYNYKRLTATKMIFSLYKSWQSRFQSNIFGNLMMYFMTSVHPIWIEFFLLQKNPRREIWCMLWFFCIWYFGFLICYSSADDNFAHGTIVSNNWTASLNSEHIITIHKGEIIKTHCSVSGWPPAYDTSVACLAAQSRQLIQKLSVPMF
jgi:hypothetical protein